MISCVFLSKLHRNGKLSKGHNSAFIDLIPNVESPLRVANFMGIFGGLFV